MAKINYNKNRDAFFSVLSDGRFHQKVDESTPGAVKREYETSDGKTGVKHELVAESIEGKITNVSIFDGDFGKNILIALGEEGDEEGVVVSLSANSNFGEDFLKKFPNIDTEKEVKLAPYSFEDDKGKKRRGITIYQGEEKIDSFYHKENKKTKKFEPVNGYPDVDKKKVKDWDSEDWKMHYTKARKFMIEELKKHPLFVEDLHKEDDGFGDFDK